MGDLACTGPALCRCLICHFPILSQKKKVKRSTRRADGDEDLLARSTTNGNGDVEMDAETPPQRQLLDREAQDNLVDDDDLQMQQAKERRKKAMKMSRRKPEDIAAQGRFAILVLQLISAQR